MSPSFPIFFMLTFAPPLTKKNNAKGGGGILPLPPPLATPLGVRIGRGGVHLGVIEINSSKVVGHYLKTPFLVCNTTNNETIRSTVEALYYGHPWDQNICT